MNALMKTLLLAFSLLSFSACTTPTSASSNTPPKGKPTAPVVVSAELGARAAKVQVTFEADADDVDISVSGVDGLVVSSPAVVVERGGQGANAAAPAACRTIGAYLGFSPDRCGTGAKVN